jgi:Protein of unknown function (DUF2726)
MNQHLIGLIVLLFVVVALVKILERIVSGRRSEGFPYEPVTKLFTPAERSFFGVLEQVFANDYRVLGKVRLGDIIHPRKGLSGSARASALNRISGKHVDFVICDFRTLNLIGVIELDDSSHATSRSQRRDDVKDKALAAAGVPLIRVPAQRGYSLEEIRDRVADLFVKS